MEICPKCNQISSYRTRLLLGIDSVVAYRYKRLGGH
jgi:hypothetical protein